MRACVPVRAHVYVYGVLVRVNVCLFVSECGGGGGGGVVGAVQTGDNDF